MTRAAKQALAGKVMAPIDPITVEVVGNAIQTIAEEMGQALIRASYSTNIKERRDCSAALFSPDGRVIAQAEHIPVHLGSLLGIVTEVLARHPVSDVRAGDVFIGNDAYTGGGTHLNDLVFMEPVFHEELLVGWVTNLAHHADFVDRGHDHIFQEGIRIPPVRLYRQGELQKDIYDLILLNCQVPDERRSDFRAQMAANRLGGQRLQDLCSRHGAERLTAISEEVLNYAERRTRAGIATIPDGTYEFEDVFDTDLVPEKLNLRVRIDVKGDDIYFDFAGCPRQFRAGINAVYTALLATVYFAVKVIVDPGTPANAGFHRPIHVRAPEGSVLNATPPAAVYSRTECLKRVVDMIFGALAPVLPDRILAASSGGALINFSGINPRTGRFYVYNEAIGGGLGARSTKDGMNGAQVHITNTSNLPVEAMELEHPLMVECYELVQDSGGAGKWRGGMSLRRRIRVLDHESRVFFGGSCWEEAPWGLEGGHSGGVCRVEYGEGTPRLSKRIGKVSAGQSIAIVTAGGGGFGPPDERDRALAERDLLEERISKPS